MPSTFRRSSLFLACAPCCSVPVPCPPKALVKPVPQPALGRHAGRAGAGLTGRKAFDEARR